MALYLDTSALVKLVIKERESEDLRQFVGRREIVSNQLARTELLRTVARNEPDSVDAAEILISGVTLVNVTRRLTSYAAWVPPQALRTLDALHVATAAAMQADLDALVTYDRRMVEAGRLAGLRVASPGEEAA